MCATASSILHWGGVPVFADISKDDYCLDIDAVKSKISEKTKAIMSVDIFGCSADMAALNEIATAHNLKIISDTAQSPFATYGSDLAGTLADIGGYSLNCHKHIHTGEGGVVVTNCDKLALKVRLIRNHAEAAIVGSGFESFSNMIGYNFRLGELESAIGREQLKKLSGLVDGRIEIAKALTERLQGLEGLSLPKINIGEAYRKNVYYILPMQLSEQVLKKVSRDRLVDALAAEGVAGLMKGYILVNELPIFQNRQCYGNSEFPWVIDGIRSSVDYGPGICPTAEQLHHQTFMGYEICLHDLTLSDINQIGNAFEKVWAGMSLSVKS
jgi:dTDP-4-amino-4,6-dideoxygalactose transaminase